MSTLQIDRAFSAFGREFDETHKYLLMSMSFSPCAVHKARQRTNYIYIYARDIITTIVIENYAFLANPLKSKIFLTNRIHMESMSFCSTFILLHSFLSDVF